MSEHVHYVKVTAAEPDEDGWRDEPDVKFECRGNESSQCRNYPGCECEYWSDDHEHPSIPQDECWMQGWFDVGGHCYIDDGAHDMDDTCLPRDMTREGFIVASFDGDCLTWEWVDA